MTWSPAEPRRVVSLLPSATEIVFALGADDALVGVSHECDFPEAAQKLRVLTQSRIDPLGTSAAIDAAVRAVLQGALSIYRVDEAALAELRPDLVITQDLCEVCAVSLDDVQAAVARLSNREQVQIVSLSPTRMADVFSDIERIAQALGRPESGRALRTELERRVDVIAARAQGNAASASTRRPRVVSLEWLDPLMVGGTWMPELIELAGGQALGARAGASAPTIDLQTLKELSPDVVVVKPCGFSLERALSEQAALERCARVLGTKTRIYVTDGNAFFNRPGPRLVESLEIMAACVRPEGFQDLHHKYRSVIAEYHAKS